MTSYFLVFLFIFFIKYLDCALLDNRIYKNIESEFICFRRFNKTHQVGCQSNQSGGIGTVHLVTSNDDIDIIIRNGTNYPYVPCLTSKFFTSENLIKFQQSKRVNGLILFDKIDDFPDEFTEDKQCPNEFSSYYLNDETYGSCKNIKWNSFASINSILDLNLDFPMLLLKNKENITSIENCFLQFNKNKKNYIPTKKTDLLCTIQIHTWMLGAKDSQTCISRNIISQYPFFNSYRFCEPMNSLNIFSNLFKYEENMKIQNRSVVILSAKLDAASIFDNSASGVSTTLTSLITFFSVVDIISKVRSKNLIDEKKGNLLYSLFDGEAFDYIGSGKTAYDLNTTGLKSENLINNENYKLKPTFFKQNIRAVLDLNQLLPSDNYFIYTDPLTRNKDNIQKILLQVKNKVNEKNMTFLDEYPLPPSSVQQLLLHDSDLPVMVLTSHNGSYINKFYNSFIDDSRTLPNRNSEIFIEQIETLSISIAEILLSLLGEENNIDLKADKLLIKKLVNCFLNDNKCSFFEEIRGYNTNLPENYKSYPLYTSLSYFQPRQYHFEYVRTVSRLLSYLNGELLEKGLSEKDCQSLNKTQLNNFIIEWFNISISDNKYESYCIKSTRFNTISISPIFLDEEPNWSLNYSSWTESIWESSRARLFVAPSIYDQYITFTLGLIIFFVSYKLIEFINSKSDVLFQLDLDVDRSETAL